MEEETQYEPTYWSEKGKYEKEYNLLHKVLVPLSGDSPTKQGQLLRAIANFYHEKYNNGFCNPISVYTDYIRKYARSHHLKVRVTKNMSEQNLDEAVDIILEHVMKTEPEFIEESDKFYSAY